MTLSGPSITRGRRAPEAGTTDKPAACRRVHAVVRRNRLAIRANSISSRNFYTCIEVDLPSCPDRHNRAFARTRRLHTVRLHTQQMQLDGALNSSERHVDRLAGCYAPRQIRNRCTPITVRVLVDANEIPDFSHHLTPFRPACLRTDANVPYGHIFTQAAADRDATRLGRMGELPMTPARHRQYPTVPLEKSDDFAYLHADSLPDGDFSDHLEPATFPPNARHNPRRAPHHLSLYLDTRAPAVGLMPLGGPRASQPSHSYVEHFDISAVRCGIARSIDLL